MPLSKSTLDGIDALKNIEDPPIAYNRERYRSNSDFQYMDIWKTSSSEDDGKLLWVMSVQSTEHKHLLTKI
jgi:hypothetical protein